MKNKGIKNLILDFGGVLIDLDRQRCVEHFKELGLPDWTCIISRTFFRNMKKA